jgi:hypothetical protein
MKNLAAKTRNLKIVVRKKFSRTLELRKEVAII